MPSRRAQVIEAVLARLGTIRPDQGYATDAGLRVHYGRADVTPDDSLPVLLLRAEDSAAIAEGNRVIRELPLTVQGIVRADDRHPLLPVEPLLDDIQRALLHPSTWIEGNLVTRISYGMIRTIDREPGSRLVAIEVGLTVRFHEPYGLRPASP